MERLVHSLSSAARRAPRRPASLSVTLQPWSHKIGKLTTEAHTIKSGEHATPEHTSAAMAGSAAFHLPAETVDELAAVGLLDPDRRPYAEIFTWSWAHGLAMLILDGPLSAFPAELRDDVIRHGLDGIRQGLTGETCRFLDTQDKYRGPLR